MTHIPTGQEDKLLLNCKNVHYIIYTLITNKYATYKELRDDYDMSEVIALYETCLVHLDNKNVLTEFYRKQK